MRLSSGLRITSKLPQGDGLFAIYARNQMEWTSNSMRHIILTMKTCLALIVFVALACAALAGDTLDFQQLIVLAGQNGNLRSPNGTTVYTASTKGTQTVIRDARSAIVATATQTDKEVVFRAPNGATMGTLQTVGGASTYRTPNGATVCVASSLGTTTTYRNPRGATTATVTQNDGTLTIRKPNGATEATVSVMK